MGIRTSLDRTRELDHAVAHENFLLEQRPHHFFDKERITGGARGDQLFDLAQLTGGLILAEQRREHFAGGLGPEGLQAQLRIVGMTLPSVAILGPIVRAGSRIRSRPIVSTIKSSSDCVGAVDPMEILEDDDRR